MSAAARLMRWGVYRQRKVEISIPPGPNFSPDLTGRAMKGTWNKLGRQKAKEMISINGLRLMDQVPVCHAAYRLDD
jgi:hypothetical protein